MPKKSTNSCPSWALDAVNHLTAADPVMKRIIEQVGPVQIAHRAERFPALVRAIIFQQLAGRAAQTILDRFVAAVGTGAFPTPDQVLAATDELLRGAGLSRGKTAYLRDLATHVRDGTLNFHRFSHMTDDEVIEDLTRVRGIGRWTAEMFLMFNLHRPDVLPVDDLGLRNAATKEYGVAAPVTAKILREMGETWRPYRTAASWYLWQTTRTIVPDGIKPAEAKEPIAAPKAKAQAKGPRSKKVSKVS